MSWGPQGPFRVSQALFLFDVFLHELGDNLVLMKKLSLELLDLAVLDIINTWRASRPDLGCSLGLFKYLPDPVMNVARLGARIISDVRDRFLTTDVPPDDLYFGGRREPLGCLVHGR
jgi:hypothetical protein